MRHNKDRVLAALSTDRKEGKRKTERNKGKKASGLSYLRIPARFDGIELQDCPAAAVILPGFFNQDLDFFFSSSLFSFFLQDSWWILSPSEGDASEKSCHPSDCAFQDPCKILQGFPYTCQSWIIFWAWYSTSMTWQGFFRIFQDFSGFFRIVILFSVRYEMLALEGGSFLKGRVFGGGYWIELWRCEITDKKSPMTRLSGLSVCLKISKRRSSTLIAGSFSLQRDSNKERTRLEQLGPITFSDATTSKEEIRLRKQLQIKKFASVGFHLGSIHSTVDQLSCNCFNCQTTL